MTDDISMPKKQSLVARIILALVATYATLTSMLVLLWQSKRMPWWAEVSNIFAAHWFWPLAGLVPLAACSRNRRFQAAVAVPGVLFLTLFGRRLLPRVQPTILGRTLRVATYNMCYLNQNTAEIVAAICALDADIVALQELTPPVAAVIERELSEYYPFRAMLPAERQHGLGLLSRFPITATAYRPEYRGQCNTLDDNGVPLTVLNVHPTVADIRWRKLVGNLELLVGYAPGARADQLAALVQAVDTIQGNIIVAGDFNTSDREPIYRMVATRLRDSFAEAGNGFGFTFPLHFPRGLLVLLHPLVRIDYIWYRGTLTPIVARVEQANGRSDHCIVVTDFGSSTLHVRTALERM